jgi:hypothetical protein
MTQKWFEKAEKSLDKGDSIQKSYAGKLDGKFGYLCISTKKLVFVNVEGFLSKKYNIIMNIPLSNISELTAAEKYVLNISLNGERYAINLDVITSEKLVHVINELRQKLMVVHTEI